MVSVIVVFKNELENLMMLVPKLLDQTYQNFELILCNDFSDDGGNLYAASIKDHRVKVLTPSQDLPGKKLALKEAVAVSLGQYILVTDADCNPASDNWIGAMMSKMFGDNKIVLGYSPHLALPGLLNKFIRYETFLTALQYLSFAISKIPYMGVGRNLMYKKDLMMESEFFKTQSKIISGDDDLFINEVAEGHNTTVCIDKQSFMPTKPAKNLRAFFRQKKRHLSTAKSYKALHSFLLLVYSTSHILVYILLFVNVVLGNYWLAACSYFLFLLIRWIICKKAMKRLSVQDLLIYFPVLDFLMVCYYLIMFPFTLTKSKHW